MTAAAVTPDQFTFLSLVELYGKRGDMQKMEAIVKTMKEVGLSPQESVATALISAYGKHGFVAKAEELFEQVLSRKFGGAPNEILFTAIITAHCRCVYSVPALLGDSLALQIRLCSSRRALL